MNHEAKSGKNVPAQATVVVGALSWEHAELLM